MSEKILKRESQAVWFERIQDWQQSGLSKAAYCRQFELNSTSFYKWFAKFQRTDRATKKALSVSPAFVPVKITPEPTSTITLHCGDVSISFNGLMSPEQVLPWIKALRLGTC